MATTKEKILELYERGYKPDEIYREMRSLYGRRITKSYISHCLAAKETQAMQARRIELIYEMSMEILAILRKHFPMRPEERDLVLAKIEGWEHDVMSGYRPLSGR